MTYNPANNYWIVSGDTTQVYSSASAQYVPVSDASYQTWLALGNLTSRINSEAELWDVLSDQFPAGIAAGNVAGQDELKNRQLTKLDQVAFQIAFNHENRIRTLAGQANITRAQFLAAIKALL
jgi:hypothetical protein